jgi:hypothetical protein
VILVAPACLLLLVAVALLHYEGLLFLDRALPMLPLSARATVLVLVIGTFAVHAGEIVLYACGMDVLAHSLGSAAFGPSLPTDFRTLLYFSTETYTSLGYGDVVPHGPLRLLAGAEALTGLLMIGWSTSHLFVWMQQSWKTTAFSQGSRPGLPHQGQPGTRCMREVDAGPPREHETPPESRPRDGDAAHGLMEPPFGDDLGKERDANA